ncbi:MAG: DUF3298 domain-containing protein [Sphingobacteriales bacterium]|nr:MAG: DUF3298 domain-containing protein [Sphingobacteriales bacterium]
MENQTSSPAATFTILFPRPENADLLTHFSLVLDSIPGDDWNILAKRRAGDYFTNYKKVIKAELVPGMDRTAAFLNYYQGTRGYIKYNDNGYVVLEDFSDEYTGGAHGYYFSTTHNYDVTNNKELQLTDVLRADKLLLRTLLEAKYLKDHNLPIGSPIKKHLFVDHLDASQNFYFNEHGIAFIYHPYEIASYAEGQITILLPYASVKNYLTPAFAQRMKIN